MNKEKFLKKLREKLTLLEDSEVDDIITEYSNHINEKVKDGKTEEEAVNGFGSVDLLAKEILKGYKISDNYRSGEWFNKLSSFIKGLVDSTINYFDNLASDKNIDSTNALASILVAIILLFIVNLVSSGIYHIGNLLLRNYLFEFDLFFVIMWATVINVVRVIVMFAIIYTTYKNIVTNTAPVFFGKNAKVNREKKEEVKKKKGTKTTNSEVVESSVIRDNNRNYSPTLVSVILKAIVVLMSLPFIAAIVGLIVALVIFIGLLFNGVVFIGIIIVLIGLILIFSSIVDFMFSIIGGSK